MTGTRVKLWTDEEVWGPMWEWCPREGWFSLVVDEPVSPRRIYLRDVVTAVTEGERVGILSPGVPRIEDRDEVARARAEGWDGR